MGLNILALCKNHVLSAEMCSKLSVCRNAKLTHTLAGNNIKLGVASVGLPIMQQLYPHSISLEYNVKIKSTHRVAYAPICIIMRVMMKTLAG